MMEETDSATASLLIRGLISIVTAAIAATVVAAVTATIEAAATVDTARRRNIDSATGRRRRRNIDLAAAAPIITAAPVIAAAPVITAAPIRDRTIATGKEAKCFGLGRNGGGSECESCRGHNSYPAEFQHHDTSPVIIFGGEPARGL
jgi:hypothetical protein